LTIHDEGRSEAASLDRCVARSCDSSEHLEDQNDFTKRFPVIAQAVSALDHVILIVALDEPGQPRFEWLVNRRK
jgi:hypothetical protein